MGAAIRIILVYMKLRQMELGRISRFAIVRESAYRLQRTVQPFEG